MKIKKILNALKASAIYLLIPIVAFAAFTVPQGGTGIATCTGILQGSGTAPFTCVSTNGTGNVVLTTSPTLITPILGVAAATTINKVTITAPATGSTLTIADAKTLTVSNNVTLSMTGTIAGGGSSQTFTLPATTDTIATLAASQIFTNKTLTSPVINTGVSGTAFGTGIPTFLLTPTSANLATALTDETGTGANVFATSPTLVTPVLGVATGTSFNGVALTTGGSATTFLNGAGSYAAPFALTTTGTSGAATFSAGTLNIPQYTGGAGITLQTGGVANGSQSLLNLVAGSNITLTDNGTGSVTIASTGGGAVSSVANSDSTLTVSPTTGSVIASLNLAHANTWTGAQTISTVPLAISGNQSTASWTTSGTQLSVAAATLNDTTSTGTVTTEAASAFGIPTITATSSTTFTNFATVYIAGAPVNSTNATITNKWALYVGAGNSQFGGTITSGGSITGGNFQTTNSFTTSDFATASSGAIGSGTSTASFLFGGAATVMGRAFFAGTTSTTLGVSNSYANVIVTSAPVTAAASGTHAVLANMVINPIGTVTNASSIAITNTASLYVNGAGSGGTNNYALLVSSGSTSLGGTLAVTGHVTLEGTTSTGSTGSGLLVFGTAPTITLANGTGLPVSTGISGLGTGIATWLATPSFTNLNAAVTGDSVAGLAATQTLTNKRINSRITTIASSATPTPAGDSTDEFTVTALAAGATFAAPTGTPVDGQKLLIRIKDNGSAQTLAWNAIYRASSDLSLPTTTIISKTMYLGFVYNAADSKWDFNAYLNNF